jgi:hypothetical protein
MVARIHPVLLLAALVPLTACERGASPAAAAGAV